MKLVILTLVTMLCGSATQAASYRLKIGHRDFRQMPVLDITPQHLQGVAAQAFAGFGYTNIQVANIDISDNALNPNYYASIGITVTFTEPGVLEQQKVSFLYPIKYDARTNTYYGDKNGPQLIESGGSKNPDNNFCVARNCVGCATMRDINGKTCGCGPCIPTDLEKPYDCSVTNTSGIGTARIIGAIGGLLKGLITIF